MGSSSISQFSTFNLLKYVVEASGFRWAVTVAKGKGGDKFLFDGDALGIIQIKCSKE